MQERADRFTVDGTAGCGGRVARTTRIFISHSSKDDPYAGAVHDAVDEKLRGLGFDVLLDRTRLDPGDDWSAKLYRWMGASDRAVLLDRLHALDDIGLLRVENRVLRDDLTDLIDGRYLDLEDA